MDALGLPGALRLDPTGNSYSLHRKLGRLLALEVAINVPRYALILVDRIRPSAVTIA